MTEENTTQTGDAELLKEIRDNYRYATDMWREQREHRQVLMRYLCGDPWDDADKKARADAGRPCISHDELNQYVNQCVNAARQGKKAIKIEPAGNGATAKTAELREDIARTIEYKSKAQSVYLRAYQDCVEGSYGFARVSRRYLNDDTDEQEIVIKPINNPDSVLYDPDCKEADWADATFCFVLDPMPIDTFKRKFPDAEVKDFSEEDKRTAQDWLQEKTVLVAEYWKVEIKPGKGKTGRKIEKKNVVQYITNGIEILEKNPQPGMEIPIPSCTGMERFVDEGSGPTRKLYALSSFALDPQMTLAFLVSQEIEEAGLTPKTPYIGYVGQFETDSEAWDSITKIPRARVQADPIVDAATGQVLALPHREQFTPNFAAYEVAKESARRAIQAAMASSPLPTSAQRQNQKSGVALEKIEVAREIGSFHFVDGYERFIERTGRIINSWIPVTYDTEREMGLHQADESRRIVKLNSEVPNEAGEIHKIGDEDHDVTIGTGPSAASQEEAAQDFLDLLVQELKNLPIAPPQQAKLLSLAIKQKQLGPKGDEMAEIISPDDQAQLPPQAQQALSKAQQETQHMHAYAQQLEGELQQLQFEKKAKLAEHQGDMELELLKQQGAAERAEITTKFQSLEERLKTFEDMQAQFHQQAHEAGMQAQDQAHAQNMQQQQAEAQAQQQAAAQQPDPSQQVQQ